MSQEGPVATAEVGPWRIDSNSATKAEIVKSIGSRDAEAKSVTEHAGTKPDKDAKEGKPPAEEKIDPSKAASELGKLGGKASAKQRARLVQEAREDAGKAEDAGEEAGEAQRGAQEAPEKGLESEKAKEDAERPLGKPRDDPRARMLDATRKESEAKRARDAERAEKEQAQAELQKLRSEFDALKRGDKPPERRELQDPSKPVPEDFDDYEQYLDSRDEWNRLRWSEEVRRQQSVSAREAGIDRTISKFREKFPSKDVLEAVSETLLDLKPTFELGRRETAAGGNWLANELLMAEDPPALMRYLSEHEDELGSISVLRTPREVSRAVARIEERIAAAAPKKEPEKREGEEHVSKAAPPVKPVSGAPYVSDSDEYQPGMSFDQYARIRQKQLKRSR